MRPSGGFREVTGVWANSLRLALIEDRAVDDAPFSDASDCLPKTLVLLAAVRGTLAVA